MFIIRTLLCALALFEPWEIEPSHIITVRRIYDFFSQAYSPISILPTSTLYSAYLQPSPTNTTVQKINGYRQFIHPCPLGRCHPHWRSYTRRSHGHHHRSRFHSRGHHRRIHCCRHHGFIWRPCHVGISLCHPPVDWYHRALISCSCTHQLAWSCLGSCRGRAAQKSRPRLLSAIDYQTTSISS